MLSLLFFLGISSSEVIDDPYKSYRVLSSNLDKASQIVFLDKERPSYFVEVKDFYFTSSKDKNTGRVDTFLEFGIRHIYPNSERLPLKVGMTRGAYLAGVPLDMHAIQTDNFCGSICGITQSISVRLQGYTVKNGLIDFKIADDMNRSIVIQVFEADLNTHLVELKNMKK
jgi:hypothetical protein